jgi:hypothetical protein
MEPKPPADRQRYIQVLRRMTPGQRLAKALELGCAFCQPHLQSALLIQEDRAIATKENSDGQGAAA